MSTHRIIVPSLLLLAGCPGVWSGDWQAWLDENPTVTDDTEVPDTCDTGDADCDGYIDDDCDPVDPEIHPGADEVPYDGVDQDCDGADLTDVDGDGYDAPEVGGDDCDDGSADVNPGALEVPCNDVDEDCDDTLVEDGMVASFAASGMGPSAVELSWDPAGQRVLAFFGAEDDGSCSGATLRYRAFDVGLNLLVDQDITPGVGLGTGATVAPVVSEDGDPSLVAWSSCADAMLLLEPEAGDHGDWAGTAVASGLGSVQAVAACTPGDGIVQAAYTSARSLGAAQSDHGWSWATTQGGGSWTGLDMACFSSDEAGVASSDTTGLQVASWLPASDRISAPETVHRGASGPQGAHGPGGAPWVLFFEDASADSLGYAWQASSSETWSLSVIAGVTAGTDLDASGAAVTASGDALLALIDQGGFHLRRIELESGTTSTWSDTSLERSYADVVVDELERAWYLYGSDSSYKLGVLCPE